MDEVVLDADGSECEIVEAAAVPRRKRCRTAKLTVDMVDKVHKPWLIAVFSSEEPCLSDACLALVQQRLAQDMQPRVGQVCMGFLVASWRILPYSQLDTSEAQAMLAMAGRRSNRVPKHAFIYDILEYAVGLEGLEWLKPQDMWPWRAEARERLQKQSFDQGVFSAVCAQWVRDHQVNVSMCKAIHVDHRLGDLMLRGLWPVLKAFGFNKSLPSRELLWEGPSREVLGRILSNLPECPPLAQRDIQPPQPQPASLQLATQHGDQQIQPLGARAARYQPYGGLALLRFLELGGLIRDKSALARTSKAALFALYPGAGEQMWAELQATGHRIPSKRVLLDAGIRMDAVANLLHRRKHAKMMRAEPATEVERHLSIDSSPSSGMELLGIVVDEFTGLGEAVVHKKLPPVYLAHGFSTVLCKAMALLWSIWLVAGPGLDSMRAYCNSVKSMTTDWGGESNVAYLPDVLPVFMKMLQNSWKTPRHLHIEQDSRLFPCAVWVPGWNHLFSNMMNFCLSALPSWPGLLQQLKACVRFFKIKDYRDTLAAKLKGQGLHDQAAKLSSFEGNFAKWRFETVETSFRAMLHIKDICQRHFVAELFGAVQDRALLSQVDAAVRSLRFWSLLQGLSKGVALLDEAGSSSSKKRGRTCSLSRRGEVLMGFGSGSAKRRFLGLFAPRQDAGAWVAAAMAQSFAAGKGRTSSAS